MKLPELTKKEAERLYQEDRKRGDEFNSGNHPFAICCCPYLDCNRCYCCAEHNYKKRTGEDHI